MSAANVVSADTLLVSRSGLDRALVDAAREPGEPLALGAVAAHQLGLVRALQVGDGAIAVARKRFRRTPCRRPR